MSNTTVDRARFIHRIQEDVARYPMRLPSRLTAMEVDAALCHFVGGIEPGTRAKDLPSQILESSLFDFNRWSDEVIEQEPGQDPARVRNIIKRALLNRLSAALKAQWVFGEEGREAVFD